jgi:hypothetical protein
MSLNNVQFNRLINQKAAIEQGHAKPTFLGINTAPMLHTQEFIEKKKQTDATIENAKSSAFRSGSLGKMVPEKILQSSRDEHEYFKKSHKIFTKELLKES